MKINCNLKKILKIKFKEYKKNIKILKNNLKKSKKKIYLKINKFIGFQH